ncbi:transglutaminase family protein [Exiguobacterium sp. S22-S28]|uniref:transglutaminase-like domain-containing protein n=1 Tax=Exiguobacterium sp. S22-S28 TaxID=3342768 RepID=UPI00372D1CA0
MKKIFFGILFLLCLQLIVCETTTMASSQIEVETTTGKVEVFVPKKETGHLKLEIKSKLQVRHYDLMKGSNHFNLLFGDGNYTLSTFQSADGKRYKRITSEVFSVQLKKETFPYLHDIQNIIINDQVSRLATSLSRPSYSISQQTLATSRHVRQLLKYDAKKLVTLPARYLPNNSDTLRTKRGICYDFASLTAGLLRSQGIPTRLAMGTAKGIKGYHAWNEVYIDRQWRIIDVTRDVTERTTTQFQKRSDYQMTLDY